MDISRLNFTKAEPLAIDGAFILHRTIHADGRGCFMELVKEDSFAQHNISISGKNVIRGMHMQTRNPQGKLVTCLQGRVLDVFVDLRIGSPTCGEVQYVELNSLRYGVYIPEGCAHGFLSLEDNSVLHYSCTTHYDKESDGGIIWNDPDLGIDWGIKEPIVSPKDRQLPTFMQWWEKHGKQC